MRLIGEISISSWCDFGEQWAALRIIPRYRQLAADAERGATKCPGVAFGERYTAANQARILTARAATSAIVNSEIAASAITRSFVRGDRLSVGENAVAFVKNRKR
jgi:hypothetical protein